ncbi:MAG TPA: hypothetical protein VN734_17295 [Acidobacteriaceae bacterium]|nr:hypothetical protein [Acidobacteriaceae bacterium]
MQTRTGFTVLEQDFDEDVTREILTAPIFQVHTVDLSQFKLPNGEFRRWLHIFHVANRPTFRDSYFKVTTVLPWCYPGDEIDIEYHRAVTALNGYAQFPLAWKSFSWRIERLETSPVYAVFGANPSQGAMRDAIKARTGYNPAIVPEGEIREFWDQMKQLVLVPRADGELIPTLLKPTKVRSPLDAYSGSDEAGPPAL